MDLKICAHNKNGIRVITSDDHDHASYVSTTDVADTLAIIKKKAQNSTIFVYLRNIHEYQINNIGITRI